jgi:hypothetical protein
VLDRNDCVAERLGKCRRLALEALHPPVATDAARHGIDFRTTGRPKTVTLP